MTRLSSALFPNNVMEPTAAAIPLAIAQALDAAEFILDKPALDS
jgi:hypothetical protein